MFAHPLIGIFSKDPTVIEFGVRAMLYFCPFYFLLAIMHGLAGAIRGIGKSVPPMVIILFSLCVYRVIWIRLAVPHIPTIDGVYLSLIHIYTVPPETGHHILWNRVRFSYGLQLPSAP